MTTLEIEIAIMRRIGIRQNIIVNGTHWGLDLGNKLMHECDLLSLSQSNYATEIEIKISKHDLLKDKLKSHGHNHNHIKYLFFAVPKKLKEIALKEIPSRAGLYVVEKLPIDEWHNKEMIYVTPVKIARKNREAVKWTEKERNQLARLGTMRILGLKEQILKHKK